MHFPRLNLLICFFLSLLLAAQSEKEEDHELLELTDIDKTFGQRKRVTTDAGKASSVQYRNPLQRPQKPQDTLPTFAAKSQRAKDLPTNKQRSSEFRKRTNKQLPINIPESPELSKEEERVDISENYDSSAKTDPIDFKGFDNQSPNTYAPEILTVEEIPLTTVATPRDNESPSTPPQSHLKLFDLKNKKRRKLGYKVKVRRKKIRKPHTINDKKEDYKSSEISADPNSGSSESTSEDDSRSSYSKEEGKDEFLSKSYETEIETTTSKIYHQTEINNSNEETTPVPFVSDENPLDYHKWDDESNKQLSSYGQYYDYPTEDTSSYKDVKDSESSSHEDLNVQKEEKIHPINNTSTPKPSFERKANGLADEKQIFPLMRPPIRKPKKIAFTSKPPKVQGIETYVYGKPNLTKTTNVYKVKHEKIHHQRKEQNFPKRPTVSKKNKNIWVKKKPKTVNRVEDEITGRVNKSQPHSDTFFDSKDKHEDLSFSINDDSAVTSAMAQEVKNNRDIQPVSENSTLSLTSFHNSNPTELSPPNHDFKKHHSKSFLPFGLRSNFSTKSPEDFYPMEKNTDDVRQPMYDSPTPQANHKGIKRKGAISTLQPYKAPFQYDFEPSENKQYFVHMFQRVGEYAKPHINFADESIFAKNSPVNFLTSLKMQWEGDNNRKAKVITEDFQGMKLSALESRNGELNTDSIKAPILNAKAEALTSEATEHMNVKESLDATNAENTGQASVVNQVSRTSNSEKESTVEQNTSGSRHVSKRSLRVGGKTVRIIPDDTTSATNPSSKSGVQSYGYVIQPFYKRRENITTLAANVSSKQLNEKVLNMMNLTSADPMPNGVSVVTSISVVYNPSEETFEPNITTRRLEKPSPLKSYYVTDSYTKQLLARQPSVTKTISTSPETPQKNTSSRILKIKKLPERLAQSSLVSHDKPSNTKLEKNRKQRKADMSKRFDLLRLSAMIQQNEPQTEVINLRLSNMGNDQRTFTEEPIMEHTATLPEDAEDSYQVVTPVLKTEASESVESLGHNIEDADFFGKKDEDNDFETMNPLDKDFYISIPFKEDFDEPTTENAKIEEFDFLDLEEDPEDHDFHNEKEHLAKEAEYQKQTKDQEKKHVQKQENRLRKANQKFEIEKSPFSDWANYGVYYDSNPITDPPAVKKIPQQEQVYSVDPFPQKTKVVDNDITFDTFINSPEEKVEEKYPTLNHIPKTSFRCKDEKYLGYYADMETNCQVFHLCLESGEKYSFLCPKSSLFSQQLLTCDWWYRVDCKQADEFYESNNKMYPQRNHFSSAAHSKKSKGDIFHDDNPQPEVDTLKLQQDRKWTIEIKEEEKKPRNHKVKVQPKDSKTFRNEYKTFYERPQITKTQISRPQIIKTQISRPQIIKAQIIKAQISRPQITKIQISRPKIAEPHKQDHKESHSNHKKGDVATKAPTDYSDWLKEKGSVFDTARNNDWETAVTSDLQMHVEDQIRQKKLRFDERLKEQQKVNKKKSRQHENSYRSLQQPSVRKQKNTLKKNPKISVPKIQIPHVKPFPIHLIRDQIHEQKEQNAKIKVRIPPVNLDLLEKQHGPSNGFLVFPIKKLQSENNANEKKFEVKQKESMNKGEGRQGFWTSENLRKTRKLLPKTPISIAKASNRSPALRVPSSSVNRVNSKVFYSNNNNNHEDCDHDMTPPLPKPKYTDTSYPSEKSYRYPNPVKHLKENPKQKAVHGREEYITKVPKKIVALKYSKDGSIKPINIYLEQEKFSFEKDIAPLRDDQNKNLRFLKGRFNSKVPELAFVEDGEIKNVKTYPIRLFGIKNSNGRNTFQNEPEEIPINQKFRSGYQLYYETDHDQGPVSKKIPHFRKFNGHQSNRDKMLQAEFEKHHPNLFSVTKERGNFEPKYPKYNTFINKGNRHGTHYNHDLIELNGNMGTRSIENLNLTPLHFERKRIVNVAPRGRTVKVGPVTYSPMEGNPNKGAFVRKNKYRNHLSLKAIRNSDIGSQKYTLPATVERDPFSVPYGSPYDSEDKKHAEGIKGMYDGHKRENDDELLPLYRENPVRDDVRQIKFHIIRPYGQSAKIGSAPQSDDYRNDQADMMINTYKNRQTIPSTKTGQYLETTFVRPEPNEHLAGTDDLRSRTKEGGYHSNNDNRYRETPTVRKSYPNINSKVRFPRLNFKLSQLKNPADHIFPGAPKHLILKTVTTGPVTVQDDAPYTESYNHNNHKSTPVTTEQSTQLDQDYQLNSPNSLQTSSEEGSHFEQSEENSGDFDSHSEYDSKPFHIVRPYAQMDKAYNEDNSNLNHQQNPDSLYYSHLPGPYDDSHLYNDDYSKANIPYFKSYHYQKQNNGNSHIPRRDISKHIFTPDRHMNYYLDIPSDSKTKNIPPKNSYTLTPVYKPNLRSPSEIPVTPSYNYEDRRKQTIHRTKYELIPPTRSYKPSTDPTPLNRNVKGSYSSSVHGSHFEQIQPPPVTHGFTEDYRAVTINDHQAETTVPQTSSNFSPSPDYRQPSTTAKLEDYTQLEQEAEKKAEQYVKSLKKVTKDR